MKPNRVVRHILAVASACALAACSKSVERQGRVSGQNGGEIVTAGSDNACSSQPTLSVSHGQVKTGTGTLSYTVTAGSLPIYAPSVKAHPGLHASHQKLIACMSYFAYTRDDQSTNANWPV